MEKDKKVLGVNMSGFFNAEIGFGEAIRNNLKALKLLISRQNLLILIYISDIVLMTILLIMMII